MGLGLSGRCTEDLRLEFSEALESPVSSSRPSIPLELREALYARSSGKCEQCADGIDAASLHVSILPAYAGGSLAEGDCIGLCAKCNLRGPEDGSIVEPRDWQWNALDKIVERIRHSQVATLAAAPGAGKTVFASLVYESLRDLGLIDRLVVLAPRTALLRQWRDSLYQSRRVQLRPDGEVERLGQDGVVVTYQSLNEPTVGVHAQQAKRARTLFVLDEVHHVGEPTSAGTRPAWARWVTELIGDVDNEIHVAGVLNLSGTLWRSKSSERISTVRYIAESDGKLRSDVDFEIDAAQLIADGQLRPVDLFRRGATVELVNLTEENRVVSAIADLDEGPASRAAIRELPTNAEWRDKFVDAVLERLELRHRDLGGSPAKALIVARSQVDARAFQETANRLMRQRGLTEFAVLAVSDEPDAQQTLEDFRQQSKPGVLCTVDMAGEGYDCPDIVVVGFATNKLTPLYVRQVVARAQRVTKYERETLKRPIPAAVIIPDIPQLVQVMSDILQPIRHTLRDPIEDELEADGEDQPVLLGLDTLQTPTYLLDRVNAHSEGDARVTGDLGGDVKMDLVRRVEPEARRVGLPESDAPRMILAVTEGLKTRREEQPFDPLRPDEASLANSLAGDSTPGDTPRTEPLSIEQIASALQGELKHLAGWWAHNGDSEVANFNADVNRAGGIGKGKRPSASVEQLQKAVDYARQVVARRCRDAGKSRPRPYRAGF